MRILLVEDDAMIGDAVTAFLARQSHCCDWVTSLEDARAAIATVDYAAVLLDLNLPDGCGLTLLDELRRRSNTLPVIVLTARNTVVERVTGLDRGADDYLPKPFDLDELFARLRAVQRRAAGRAEEVVRYEDLELHPQSFDVLLDGCAMDVPVSQFRLLQHLLEYRGKLRTKQQIIDALYSWDESIAENTVEVYVSQIRKTIRPNLIKTVRGVGYMVPSAV